MKRVLFLLLLIPFYSNAQDSALTYSRVFKIDSVSKIEIYDRALIWCSKSFSDSKGAINVKDKESGIIAGKGTIKNYYKVPGKKDSVLSFIFSDYVFDWLLEIKDNKARFGLKNISYFDERGNHPVYVNSKPPLKVMFQKSEKTQMEWDMSKKYFVTYMDAITDNLYSELKRKGDNW